MTKQEEMFRRFGEMFCTKDALSMTCVYPCGYRSTKCIHKLADFLQSEIDLAVAEREKELAEIVKYKLKRANRVVFTDDQYTYFNALEEILSLITKDK